MRRHPHVRRSRSRRLMLERLESRTVLDGGIHAFVSGGTLHINGDSHNNQILIDQTTAQSFTITSRDGTTLINGQAGPQSFFGVKNNVIASLGQGNDIIEMTGTSTAAINVRKELMIDTG